MGQHSDTDNTTIATLGSANILSPLADPAHHNHLYFTSDDDRVLIDIDAARITHAFKKGAPPPTLECAGPRSKIYFDPCKVRCALVTCGGICPGLNAIIRSVVLELHYRYGVRRIFGIRYGLQGFIAKYRHDLMELTPEVVTDIMKKGGTILGSSRGADRLGIGILFMIGGDGTLVAATRIADTALSRGLKISVIGIPKTIDNDIHMVSRATAALAEPDVNFVLIPEVDFDLDGPSGLLTCLKERLKQRGHAVIVVAEGAGQKLFADKMTQCDQSGNIRLLDIGRRLKDEIATYFKKEKIDITIKYIDPSYTIRSLPANANDQVFCSFLSRNAVHAAMAGKTKVLVGHWNPCECRQVNANRWIPKVSYGAVSWPRPGKGL